jgi:hypothetical protein
LAAQLCLAGRSPEPTGCNRIWPRDDDGDTACRRPNNTHERPADREEEWNRNALTTSRKRNKCQGALAIESRLKRAPGSGGRDAADDDKKSAARPLLLGANWTAAPTTTRRGARRRRQLGARAACMYVCQLECGDEHE